MNEQEMEAINRIYDVTHLINGEHCDYIDIDNICNDEDDLESCEGFCKAIDIILILIRKQNNKIQKIKQIVDIYNNTNGEFATLPNGEEICLSDNAPVLGCLQELFKEEN